MSKDFTRKEVEYLRSVPAVKKVAKNRITYARAFQLYCMARYLRGDWADRDFSQRRPRSGCRRAETHRTLHRTVEAG